MIYKNVGDNSQQGETATVSEQDVFSAAQTDGHSSAAAINPDQSKNLPAAIGQGAIDIQGPAERIPENPTGEGVKNESLIPTESFSGATNPAAEKLDHLESPHGKSTGTTALHDSPIQALRAAAECGQNIMSGSSFVAGKKVASLGDSSETTSRFHMATGHTQQQPRKTSEIQQQQQQQQQTAVHQQRNDQHRQQQMRPPDPHHDPTLTQQQEQHQKRQLPQRPQQQDQHQQMLPTDQQHYNQHQEMSPTDQRHYNQHQQMLPTDQQHYNQHQKMSPTEQQHHNQHQQMWPTHQRQYNQHQHLQQNQQQLPPPGGQVFDQQQQPPPSNEQHDPQGDRQQCLNAEAILDNNRAEGFQLQPSRSAPGGIDSNGSSQVFQNRRGRDDPTPQTNDQSTKILEGGIEVSL